MSDTNKRIVDPVIMVPGITATYLLDEYPVSHEQVWNLLSNKFERVALHPNNLRYEAQEPARIRPGQIFEIAYKELIEELRYNLKDKEDLPIPVYPFGYDWRKPLEAIEAELDEFIQEVIERTVLLRHYHDAGYYESPKVNLIGHSMGGLVITGYLINKGKDAPVNKVVTLATPFKGSFESVLKLATGNAELGTSSNSSRERETARVTPSLYYLIPSFIKGISYAQGIPQSLFDPGAWQPSITLSIAEFIRLKGLPGDNIQEKAASIFKSLLDRAKEHSERIGSFKLEDAGLDVHSWLAVIGVNVKTRVKLNIVKTNGSADFDIRPGDRLDNWTETDKIQQRLTGDGTVPFEGAVPPFLNEENLVCITPDDYGYWELKDKALSAIGGFHGILPNMNMIHRLIVRFLKDLDDIRGNTWGSRAPGAEKWNPPLKLTEWEIDRKR
ncbi:MAG TPA: alpha/beta hydrolase [Bacteroidales bacterium]|nr:alpha/beta hydrolase [Bacteroidales bacterium]